MNSKPCSDYPRKKLYWILTFPMMLLHSAIAILLFKFHWSVFLIYLSLIILVALSMSFVCHHWKCPYIGKFAPCVGGFCLPSSRIAVLWKNQQRSEKRYKFALNIAYTYFFGIILFPIYFIFLYGWLTMVMYILIVFIYAFLFSIYIYPVCRTREVCPGGQSAMKLQKWMNKKTSS
ncbi:MAG: hypothetical protein JEZ06_22020 [Anaerolineaceae bacterium]|nr:hypothetical protein [Anaerolineaceae bacterium]